MAWMLILFFYYYRNKEEPECPPDLELSRKYPAKGQLGGPDLYLTHEIVSILVSPGKLIVGFMVGMGCITMGAKIC